MALVLWLALALVVIVASPLAVNRSAKALHAHRHARCLASIERLEIELGFRPARPSIWTAEATASRWADALTRVAAAQRKAVQAKKTSNYMAGAQAPSLVGCLTVAHVRRAVERGLIGDVDALRLLRRMGYDDRTALALIPNPRPLLPARQDLTPEPDPAHPRNLEPTRNRVEAAGVDGLTALEEEDAPSS